jgi:hypothetical protein
MDVLVESGRENSKRWLIVYTYVVGAVQGREEKVSLDGAVSGPGDGRYVSHA